ncbi:MAG: hypothetical protein AAFO81_06280 [Pseudomonadota bacterium]
MFNTKSILMMSAFICLSFHGAHAQQPTLLSNALNPPAIQPEFRHTVFIKEDEFEGLARIDPAMPAGQRVSLVTSTLAADDPDMLALLADADAEPMDGFWCHEMGALVPERVIEMERDERSVTYQFAPQPEADSDKDDITFMKNVTGEVRVDRQSGTVASLRLFAKKPFRISLAVKINAFEMHARCAALPSGGSHLVESTTQIKARALFRQLEQVEIKRISDVEPVD